MKKHHNHGGSGSGRKSKHCREKAKRKQQKRATDLMAVKQPSVVSSRYKPGQKMSKKIGGGRFGKAPVPQFRW